MADHHWHRLTPRWLQSLVLRKSSVSRKETWERGILAPPRAGLSGLLSSTLFCNPRTLLASFPDLTASPPLLLCSGTDGNAAGQDLLPPGFGCLCGFSPSEGEWGSGYLSLQWKEGLPSKMELGRSEVPPAVKGRNFQLSTWEWHTFQSLTSKRQFQKGTLFEQEYQYLATCAIWSSASFFDDTILENPPIEAEGEPIKGCLQLCPHCSLDRIQVCTFPRKIGLTSGLGFGKSQAFRPKSALWILKPKTSVWSYKKDSG